MKHSTNTLFTALVISAFLLYSCTKSANSNNLQAPANQDNVSLHAYGLLPMQPDQWSSVPVFTADLLAANARVSGLNPPATMPTSYLLYHPQVRDQGQIGCCTGFCGTETDEILYYYNKNSVTSISNLTTSSGANTAFANEIPNTSDEPYYNGGTHSYSNLGLGSPAFSPLFLYFVERVVINKGSISTDPGAYMVNIGQALQGLSNNSGTGKALTYNGYTFAGIPNEIQYEYPFVSGSGGYNVATSSTSPFRVYPYSYYSYGSSAIPVAPYSYFLNPQSGGTTNTVTNNNTTAHGYYVINSTGSQLITDVKTAIANNKPVMMGFNVYDNTRTYQYFEGLTTTKYTYNPLTSSGSLASGVKLLGGHAVPLIGFINDSSQPGGGVFICENSWGTPWGYHGYFYLPYSVLTSSKIVPAGNLYVAII